MNNVLIIGICGGSGSGKTTLAEGLAAKFEDGVLFIRYDDYYKATDSWGEEEKDEINYDCPEAFDSGLFVEHLCRLRDGGEVDIPIYDYTVHNRSNNVKRVGPSPIIIVDGILIFENEALRNLFDIKIFVDTDADIRLARRIKRDMTQRARSLDSVIEQYLKTVKPMHDKYVEPSKKYADIIIREGGYNTAAITMIEKMMESHIKENEIPIV